MNQEQFREAEKLSASIKYLTDLKGRTAQTNAGGIQIWVSGLSINLEQHSEHWAQFISAVKIDLMDFLTHELAEKTDKFLKL